ncbi:MAG: STAS domain-containing protein [Candidatus Krumholzibacteria bacterium]|nr:STAS domain-containing protein [Candidatus Krumholzibacteria bacterium]
MSGSIHLISVLGIIGKSEYVSYDFDDSGVRAEVRRYPFDPQAIPTDLNDIIEEGFTRDKMHVILDLGNIPWMNSKGLGTLVMLFHVVKDRGGELVLAKPVPEVAKLIETAHLETVFRIFPSLTEAREHLNSLPVPGAD